MKRAIGKAELCVGMAIGLLIGYLIGQASGTETDPSTSTPAQVGALAAKQRQACSQTSARPVRSISQSATEQTSAGPKRKVESPPKGGDAPQARGSSDEHEHADEADDGDRLTYPDDLDVEYRDEERMARRITEALADAELEGDVRAVDCSEFPCIVFGAFEASDASAGSRASYRAIEKLKQAAQERYDDSNVIHSYLEIPARGEQPAQVFFSLTPLPDNLSRAHRTAAIERQDERNLAYFQSATPRPSAGE